MIIVFLMAAWFNAYHGKALDKPGVSRHCFLVNPCKTNLVYNVDDEADLIGTFLHFLVTMLMV